MAGYIGTSIPVKPLTNLVSNELTTTGWTSGSIAALTTSSDYFQITASSAGSSNTNTCYSYQTMSTPIPASGVGSSSNIQYIYIQAKICFTTTSSNSYPQFTSYSSTGSTQKAYGLTQTSILGSGIITDKYLDKDVWHTISVIDTTYSGSTGYQELGFGIQITNASRNDVLKFKDLIVVEVTNAFDGIPTRKQCDENIFLHNGQVYLKNSNSSTNMLSNIPKNIERMYIGIEGGIVKKAKKAYLGINNSPVLFYTYKEKTPTEFLSLLNDMNKVYDKSRNATSTSSLSIASASYKSGLYYLFVFYYGYLSIYKVKNGVLSLTDIRSCSSTAAYIYSGSFISSYWYLSNDGGSNSSSVYGGSLVLVSFPTLTETEIDRILSKMVVYRINGQNSASASALTTNLYNFSSIDYIITTYGSGENTTAFTIWDTKYNKLYQLNSSYSGATTQGTTLSMGSVNGSILGLKEYEHFKTFKIRVGSTWSYTDIDFSFPEGENWNNFILSNKNIGGVFSFSGLTSNGRVMYTSGNNVYTVQYNGNNITYGSNPLIQEYDSNSQNYYTAFS